MKFLIYKVWVNPYINIPWQVPLIDRENGIIKTKQNRMFIYLNKMEENVSSNWN
jgi:hypothetical protein